MRNGGQGSNPAPARPRRPGALLALIFVFVLAGAAAAWTNWYATGSAVQLDDRTIVVAAAPDGEQAGVWRAGAGDLRGTVLTLRVMAADWSAVQQAQVLLSTSGNFDEFLGIDLKPLLTEPRNGEWLELTVPTAAWEATAGADWRTVGATILRVTAVPGNTALVSFRDVEFVPARAAQGIVSIAFDDGRLDVFEHAYPLLAERGLAATVYAIPELVGSETYMTQQHLYELHGAGWEVGAHGEHPLTMLSAEERRRHLNYASQWLAASRFAAPGHYAYANGLLNDEVMADVAAYFLTGRSINPHSDVVGYAPAMQLGGVSVYPTIDVDYLEALALGAARSGEWLILVFHLFADEPEVATQFRPADLARLLDFMLDEGIRVLTVGEAWRENERAARCGLALPLAGRVEAPGPDALGLSCE